MHTIERLHHSTPFRLHLNGEPAKGTKATCQWIWIHYENYNTINTNIYNEFIESQINYIRNKTHDRDID